MQYQIRIHLDTGFDLFSERKFDSIEDTVRAGEEMQKSSQFPPKAIGWEVHLCAVHPGRSIFDYAIGGACEDLYPVNTYRSLLQEDQCSI